ncbi:hypothetical protein ABZS86_11380 [Streptomyces sp. NPDC005355]|uniref:hypothetical protein n=1 Tax=Streptomyces sp. NPDC005355 TaxID=3157038 RepID=UPI0033A4EDB9
MAARFNQAAAEMLGAASVYDPEGMMEVGRDFSGFADAFGNIAQAMAVMAKRANDEFPLNPAILDQLKEMHARLRQVAEKARDLQPAFRKFHADDIKRIADPRRNEALWDLANNRDFIGGA